VQIQLRFCPHLSKKPGPEDASKKKHDPFDHPAGDLYIGDIGNPRRSSGSGSGSSYVLVLNKFAVIANHFILATKEFKPQTDALEPDDLEATFACLEEWENATAGGTARRRERLFAFFNSGVWSGASQPHRHVQLLPVEDMREGDGEGGWSLLMDRLADVPGKKDDGVCNVFGEWILPLSIARTAIAVHAARDPKARQPLLATN
jgi:ATP adenylyltransferase